MKKIGIVTTWFDRGAAYVSKAYEETLQKDHDIYIYARGGEKYGVNDDYWEDSNVTWAKIKNNWIPFYIDFSDLKKWIRDNNIDIIFFNEQQSWDIIIKLQKEDVIIGSYIDYYKEKTIPLFDLYDFLICNTQRHYTVFRNFTNCFFIPWGTNINIFNTENKIGNLENEITLFHSSGMNPIRKGTDILVNSFKKVNSQNLKLIIHSQIDLPNNILRKVEQDPRIELVIDTVKPPGLYHLGHVYVYPTRLEGIGLTIIEALASGLPVITTNCPPMNEFVIDGVNGFLIDVEKYKNRSDNYYWKESICDIESLRRILQKIADRDVDINTLSLSARKYAENNLNWIKNSNEICHIFETVSKNKTQKSSIVKAILYEYRQYPWLLSKMILKKILNRLDIKFPKKKFL